MGQGKFGNWKVGRAGSVVSDIPVTDRPNTGHEDVEFYGGYLVAESIPTKEIALLISAALDLLEACEDACAMLDPLTGRNNDGFARVDAHRILQAAIAKARGEQS